MQILCYLNFNGNCREAFEFYEKALGGKIVALFNFSEAPPEAGCGPEMSDGVMHARLQVGDGVLMGSDCPPEMYQTPQGISVSVHPDSAAEAERVFAALAEGGHTIMPIGQTFWAERFGMVVDRFGISWMVNYEKAA